MPGTCHYNRIGTYLVIAKKGDDLTCQYIQADVFKNPIVYSLGSIANLSVSLQATCSRDDHLLPLENFIDAVNYLKKFRVDFDPKKRVEAFLLALNLASVDRHVESEKERSIEVSEAQNYLDQEGILYDANDPDLILRKKFKQERFREIEALHRAKMEKHNIDTSNVTLLQDVSRTYRSSPCFACDGGVDTLRNPLCSRCKWLVCSCGCCGCTKQFEQRHTFADFLNRANWWRR